MPYIQPLFSTLHLHFPTLYYPQKNTSSNLMVFDKNVMDMDMVTFWKWMHFKLGYFDRLFQVHIRKYIGCPK
jgi:hypothetical protein